MAVAYPELVVFLGLVVSVMAYLESGEEMATRVVMVGLILHLRLRLKFLRAHHHHRIRMQM